jgi:hypothetical protein
MVTALSNGGNRVVPQFQRSRIEKTAMNTKVRGTIDLPDSKIERVIPGMIGAAEYGTARRGVEQSWGVAGKTGSCIGRGSWVGLFASVAPVEDPKYSVVVITRGEGERGRIAAGIAGQIYRALAPQLRRDQGRYMALKQKGTQPNTDSTLAAVGDDEEEDDDTAELDAAPEAGRPVIVAGASQRPVAPVTVEPKKTVVRTAQSQPKNTNFPPVVIQYSKDEANKTVKPTVKPAAKPMVKPTVKSTPKTSTKPAANTTSRSSTKPEAEKSRPRIVKNK